MINNRKRYFIFHVKRQSNQRKREFDAEKKNFVKSYLLLKF